MFTRLIFCFFGLLSFASMAAENWPGLPPDCWSAPRMVHIVTGEEDLWQRNTKVTTYKGEKPKQGILSPNKGYFFVVESGRPSGKITIYAEKDHLTDIVFSELYGLSDVHWVNEKLIFMRVWWGKISATDIIFDVEKEKIIYTENMTDGDLAYQQSLKGCPVAKKCDCERKSSLSETKEIEVGVRVIYREKPVVLNGVTAKQLQSDLEELLAGCSFVKDVDISVLEKHLEFQSEIRYKPAKIFENMVSKQNMPIERIIFSASAKTNKGWPLLYGVGADKARYFYKCNGSKMLETLCAPALEAYAPPKVRESCKYVSKKQADY